MKKLLIALSVLLLTACAAVPDKIDPVATANAPWEVGEVVYEKAIDASALEYSYKRYFVGVAEVGGYIVRDETRMAYTEEGWEYLKEEYEAQGIQRIMEIVSDPYALNEEDVDAENLKIKGAYITRYSSGEKNMECYFDEGTTKGEPCYQWNMNGKLGGKMWMVNGVQEKSLYFHPNGQLANEVLFDVQDGSLDSVKHWDENGHLISEKNFRE